MSRDLTPRELYEFEQYNIQNGAPSLWDFMKHTTFTYGDQTTPLYTEEELSQREQYPLLGRLYQHFNRLYSFLSQVNGGMDLLSRHEAELFKYIHTGKGDKDSFLIKWYEGKLDNGFYYSNRNDELFLASVKDEIGSLYRFDPKQENCFWFALSPDKCISVWYAPDKHDGDQLQMKLEERAEDGSMGAFCEVLSDESYATADLSYKAISSTLREIYEDAELSPSESSIHELTEKVMSVFSLTRADLETQLNSNTPHCTINREKLKEYIATDMILEFHSPEECMEYFNTYDGQNFKTTDELKRYQAEYGFGLDGKWYHINYREALDVWEKSPLNAQIQAASARTETTHSPSRNTKDIER